MPLRHETLVFFDDSRYMLSDASSLSALEERLSERVSRTERKTLLVLADRRVNGGELMEIASLAKRSGAEKVLFAEKSRGSKE
jgi:biopolymer transport protein ExbD